MKVIIEKAINELENRYNKNKDNFFNEHDFHHIFFNIVHSELEPFFHPEYPTVKRFIRKKEKDEEYQHNKHSFSSNKKMGRRGHYDFVLLSKDFYEKNNDNFLKISNKKLGINDNEQPFIEFALEFKYFINNTNMNEIKFDIFKLREGNEIKNKILIIFIRKNISIVLENEIKEYARNDVNIFLIK